VVGKGEREGGGVHMEKQSEESSGPGMPDNLRIAEWRWKAVEKSKIIIGRFGIGASQVCGKKLRT